MAKQRKPPEKYLKQVRDMIAAGKEFHVIEAEIRAKKKCQKALLRALEWTKQEGHTKPQPDGASRPRRVEQPGMSEPQLALAALIM